MLEDAGMSEKRWYGCDSSPAGLSDVLPNVKPYVPRIGKVGQTAHPGCGRHVIVHASVV